MKERPELDEHGQPIKKVGEALQRRAQAEAQFTSLEELARFRAEHHGMSPLEVLLANFPSLADAVHRDKARRVRKP
jgi:hypothetical protein